VLSVGAAGADQGVNEGMNKGAQEDVHKELEFTYSAEQVRALPAECMSVVLLQALVGMVCCRGTYVL